MSVLTHRPFAQLFKPDGSPIDRPPTLIGTEAATIIRAYFTWAMQNQLDPELVCGECFNHTRADRTIYDISDDAIHIICGCQVREFHGRTPPPHKLAPMRSIPVDASGPLEMQLFPVHALLLRQYKKVLIGLNLKEALRCNACYELGQSDGCEAHVTDRSILIRCRCSRRTYQGMSV